MFTTDELKEELGTSELVVISKSGFESIVSVLTDAQKKKIKKQNGGEAPHVVYIEPKEEAENLFMTWSRYLDCNEVNSEELVEDYTTDAPNGTYTVQFNYLGNSASRRGIVVEDGRFKNPDEILTIVARARNDVGYWGTFLEDLTFDGEKFEACIGS